MENELSNDNNSEVHYPEFIINLTQTILFIYTNKEPKTEIRSNCSKVIVSQIRHIIKMIKQNGNEKETIEMKSNEKDNLEQEILQGIKLLHGLRKFTENKENKEFFTENVEFHECFQLIHLNCPSCIKCSQAISIPNTTAIQDLQSAVFGVLGELQCQNVKFKEQFQDKHQLFDHIIPIVIQFSQLYQSCIKQSENSSSIFQQQQQQQKQQQTSIITLNFSHTHVAGCLYFLLNILQQNNLLCIKASFNSDLITSLIALLKYKQKQHEQKMLQKGYGEIRTWSIICLFAINNSCNEEIRRIIINKWKLLCVSAQHIALCGGNEEERSEDKYSIYRLIRNILLRIPNPSLNCSALTDLIHIVNEDFEEEGCLEEIESNLFVGNLNILKGIRNLANETKQIILNALKQ